MFDLYQTNSKDTCRFILGRSGNRPLFVVGLNPSTASRDKSDVTASKVAHVAYAEGFDGFVLVNLYPWRSTRPNDLPLAVDEKIWHRNLKAIIDMASQQPAPHFWAAWGSDIKRRKYLEQSCQRLCEQVSDIGGSWSSFGPPRNDQPKGSGYATKTLLTKKGHPRHPSRLCYGWSLQPFDARSYLLQPVEPGGFPGLNNTAGHK